jgi:hypothetical protein
MDETLGDFDEMIRKERERIARERDARRGEATGAAGGEGDGQGSGPSGGDMRSESSEGEQQAESGEAPQQPAEGDMQSEGGGASGNRSQKSLPTPANVPSGDDDDIIARQIREAAEKETDPELREKLWQEYIEYKRNAKR